jgi:hypothetical protein
MATTKNIPDIFLMLRDSGCRQTWDEMAVVEVGDTGYGSKDLPPLLSSLLVGDEKAPGGTGVDARQEWMLVMQNHHHQWTQRIYGKQEQSHHKHSLPQNEWALR